MACIISHCRRVTGPSRTLLTGRHVCRASGWLLPQPRLTRFDIVTTVVLFQPSPTGLLCHLRRRRIIRGMPSISATSKVVIFVCSGLLIWAFYSGQGLAMITPFPRAPSWQDIAAKKRQSTLDKIPKAWVLTPTTLETAKHQRSIAGEFLVGLLDIESRRITNTDGLEIVKSTSTGTLTVVQVVTAFAKRASYAHQLVCLRLHVSEHCNLHFSRITIFWISMSRLPFREPGNSTVTGKNTKNP